ncbi:trichohyalin [Danio aesculapii]|uniref:trichohyalin n=1 Tax=Danio aesculapii TaxID=1142201 RepID=UPI0024BFB29E|nr:trichohyalin [Danio aesculapii]
MTSMREVNLDTYSLSLLTAKEDILNPRSSTNWALFTYDGIMNRLRLADSGVGGLKELSTKLNPRLPLYGMCRVGKAQPRFVMILWVGKDVEEYRRAECQSHIPAIRAFFKEVHIFLPAHTLDEITEERICALACKSAGVPQGSRARPGRRTEDRHATVGTNYKRTIAAAEIQRIQRDSFWAQMEREEEERKKEEQRRAAEDRRQRERERMIQEKREATERERRMQQQEEKIKEQRRIQAQLEAEAHKQEKIKWEHQKREREDEEVRSSRSESEEKAAEAAALVSQRPVNPREFFRQLSSSSIQTGSRPNSPRPDRSPFKRLHRSQTDSIFSFNEPPSSSSSRISSQFPTPTSQSPTIFTKTTLPNGTMVSAKSKIQISSPKLMVSFAVSTIAPQLQSPPIPPTKLQLKSPISEILDSLVFYPPPPIPEQLHLNEQPETVTEFPPPPPGFEDSPEDQLAETSVPSSCVLVPEPPSRPLPALPVAPRMLTDLEIERDFTARASVISTVEEEEENEERDVKDCEEYEGTIQEKQEAISEKGEMGEEQDEKMMDECQSDDEKNGHIVDASEGEGELVWTNVEDFENGKEDGEMLGEHQESEEKLDENIIEGHERESEEALEEFKDGNELDGEILEEQESEGSKLKKKVEEFESQRKQDEKMLEEIESEEKLDGNIMEGHEREIEQTLEELKDGNELDGKNIEEQESEGNKIKKNVEEFESQREKVEEIEEFESEEILDPNIMEGLESETVEEFKDVKKQDGNILGEQESQRNNVEEVESKEKPDEIMGEQESEGNKGNINKEEFESGKIKDGKMLEEVESEEKLKEHIMERLESAFVEEFIDEKKQDGNFLEEQESEENKVPKNVKEFESEICQDEKKLEEVESEGKQDGIIMKGHEREEDDVSKNVEQFKDRNEQDVKCFGEQESEEIQHAKWINEEQEKEITRKKEEDGKGLGKYTEEQTDDKTVAIFESKKEEDEKSMEILGMERINNERIMEECVRDDGKELEKCEEKCGTVKEADGKIVEELEADKMQDKRIMEEQKSEELQHWKCTEDYESEKIQILEYMSEDEKTMIKSEEENEQDGNIVEKCEEENVNKLKIEKIQHGSNKEEIYSQKVQGSGIGQEFGCEKEHDEESVMENIQHVRNMEDREQGNEMVLEKSEENEREKEQGGKITENSEKQDGKSLEKHEKQHGGEMLERGNEEKQDGKTVQAFGNEKDDYRTSMEGSETEKIQDEFGQENEPDGKIEETSPEVEDLENAQDLKMTDCMNEKIQYGDFIKEQVQEEEKIREASKTEKIQGLNIITDGGEGNMEEHESEKDQGQKMKDGTTAEELEGKKERELNMTDCLNEKIQYGDFIKEYIDEQEDEKIREASETEKIQCVNIITDCGEGNMEENESEKDQGQKIKDGKTAEELEGEKERELKMTDCMNEKIQHGDFIKEEQVQEDEKIREASETEKIQCVNIITDYEERNMEELEREKELAEKMKDGKTAEELEGEKEWELNMTEDCESENIQYGDYEEEKAQDEKTIEKIQHGNTLEECLRNYEHDGEDGRIMKEHVKIQNANIMSKHLRENDCKIDKRYDQDWKLVDGEGEKTQYGNIIEKHENEGDQDDMMKAVNVCVLRKEESFTEIIKRHEKADAEEMKSYKPIKKDECSAEMFFSQHAPPFPESHVIKPCQHIDTNIPKSITASQTTSTDTSHQINLPNIQAEPDLSNLRDPDDMKETMCDSKNSADTMPPGQGPNKDMCVIVEDVQIAGMINDVKTLDSSSEFDDEINTESKASSPVSENQERIGQSDEGEELVAVSHFLEEPDTAMDIIIV